jgi:hypothetical protein
MANLATKAGIEGKLKFKIHTPLINLSKADIIKKGTELGVDYSLTCSCYAPLPDGMACGECDSCRLRLKGFEEAGFRDPIFYKAMRNMNFHTSCQALLEKEIFFPGGSVVFGQPTRAGLKKQGPLIFLRALISGVHQSNRKWIIFFGFLFSRGFFCGFCGTGSLHFFHFILQFLILFLYMQTFW